MRVIEHPHSKTTNKNILKGRILEDAVFEAIKQLENKCKEIIYLENEEEGLSLPDCIFLTDNPPLIFLVECKNWDPLTWTVNSEKTRKSMFGFDLRNLVKGKFDFNNDSNIIKKFDIDSSNFEEKFGIPKAKFFENGKIKINRFIPLLIYTGHFEITVPLIQYRIEPFECPICGNVIMTEDTKEKAQKVVCKKCKSIFKLIEKSDKNNLSTVPEEFKNIQFPSSIEKEAIKKIHREKFIGRPIGISYICISDRSIEKVNQDSISQILHKLDLFLSPQFYHNFK
jgi:hypothetical protein